ncbi:CU044_5270 family protein [Streptomyces sp. NPDC006333]|uniref:CU044_5270 family protein n=1 Tax=Streptomyces sp. NPDC006333 TaxID=3156753 RepID=UPI0033A53DC6
MKNTTKHADQRDVMKVLGDARPEELDPSLLVDPARQQQVFARIITDSTDSRHDGRIAAPGHRSGFRPLGAVALSAVAAAVVVAVGTIGQQGPTDRPTAQPQPSAPTQPANSGSDIRVDGHIELLSAAKNAEASPAEGTYWQTTTRTQHVDVADANGQLIAVSSTGTDEASVGVRSGTKSLMVSGVHSVTEPRTPADKNRWNAAGAPHTVVAELGQESGNAKIAYSIGPGRPMVMRTNIDNKIYAVGPNNVTYKDLRALPSTSDALRRHLEALYARDNGADSGTSGRSGWMLRQAGNLITMPVKPSVRAAAYRVMADLPGVRVIGHITDPLGRPGVAVEFPAAYRTPLGTTRERLVVDPATGAMLSDQTLLVKPSVRAKTAGLSSGTTINYAATTRMGWGEQQITVPKNAHS